MTKVTIEIDLPMGVSKAEAEGAVKRAFDPDWVADWWHISDVHDKANGWDQDESKAISDDEAREVLRLMERHHDSEIGLNWDVIDSWINHVKGLRKEIA